MRGRGPLTIRRATMRVLLSFAPADHHSVPHGSLGRLSNFTRISTWAADGSRETFEKSEPTESVSQRAGGVGRAEETAPRGGRAGGPERLRGPRGRGSIHHGGRKRVLTTQFPDKNPAPGGRVRAATCTCIICGHIQRVENDIKTKNKKKIGSDEPELSRSSPRRSVEVAV